MKNLRRQKLFSRAARWLCALLAALVLPANVFAQPKSPERWLLIFDLSPAMQKRLPATEAVLKNLFATSAEGRLQEGDDVGVWTYDQKMHAGQFPLVTWNPKQSVALTTNLIGFLRSQKFTGGSKLSALQPALNGLTADSERLTVIIFCAGESEISATPYDRGINQSFLDGRAERKKNQQPFVVLIRTLSGKPIGCTVNFPPGAINIPLFLAPPPPPPQTNTPPPHPRVVAPVKPAPVAVPDLVIVGTHVAGTVDAPPKVVPPVTNSATVEPPKKIAEPASEVPLPKIAAPASNTVTQPKISTATPATTPATATPVPPATNQNIAPPQPAKAPAPVPIPATNAPVTAAHDTSDGQTRLLVFAGIGLLAAAILVVIMLIVRQRRPQSSLITSSMEDDPRRK